MEQVADALDSFRNLIIVSFDFDLVGSCLAFIDIYRQLEYNFLEISPGAHLNLLSALLMLMQKQRHLPEFNCKKIAETELKLAHQRS